MIRGLNHNAWRCRASEETRRFHEDFLGLPLASALAIETTKTGRGANVLHTFYGRRLVPGVLRGAGAAVRVQAAA